jgi:putative endonuclease
MTDYTVYILKCSDGTLYTGITNDLDKRILTHNKGKGALNVCTECLSAYIARR